MSLELENQAPVQAAVRRVLKAGPTEGESHKAMALLISETSNIELSNLDMWERFVRAELWKSENDKSASKWMFWKTPSSFASWLDLCNGNGFKRERALRSSLGGAPNAFFLSLAVRRLNDWVPEVRAAAEQRLPQIAELSDPKVVVDVLWNTLPNWTSWGRLGDSNREVLLDLVSREPVSRALRTRLMEATAGPATAILAQAGRTDALDPWLGDLAKGAIQPSLRARAYRCLLEGRMTWVAGHKWIWTDKRWCKGRIDPVLGERPIHSGVPFQSTLRSALVDPSPLVRRIAADQLMLHKDSVGADFTAIAEALAADPAPYIAERGRFILSRSSSLGR
jgi:hypothetical protein